MILRELDIKIHRYIYRAAPLLDNKKSIVADKKYLYYSAYDLRGIPKIGFAKLELGAI
jgi:hypothetical protein